MGNFLFNKSAYLAFIILVLVGCNDSMKATNGRSPASTQSTDVIVKSDTVVLTEKANYENITAQNIYHQITGVTIGLHSPVIEKMSVMIKQGQTRSAVQVAVESDDFINVTARTIGSKLTVRSGETMNSLNDFVATFMGAIRDNVDARELLTGNFYYRVEKMSGVSDDAKEHIVKSNTHYEQLDSTTLNISPHLKKEDGQKVLDQSGAVVTLNDAAGLLTTRGFLSSHAKAGTNRRIVEYAFNMFLCTPIQSWASTQRTDHYIGRDVSRTPASEFNNKCKGCHSGMDALRPATAYFDFVDSGGGAGFIAHQFTYTVDPDEKDPTKIDVPVPANEQQVPYKFRRAATVYKNGYRVQHNEWTNYSDTKMFGWKKEGRGKGMKEFGELIATSDRYASCLGERFFEAVCKKTYGSKYKSLVNSAVTRFKSNNYSIKDLATEIALHQDCFGLGN